MPVALQQLQDIYLATTVTPGEKPGPAQLQLGELAFNVADQLMFVGTGGGAYITVDLTASGGGTPPDNTSIVVSAGTLSVNRVEGGTF